MFAAKRFIHRLVMSLSGVVTRFLPDRVPVTFVGMGSSRELCESIAHTGAKKVLIVTDDQLVQIGLVEGVGASLQAAGVEVSTYSGVEPDPTFLHVEAGLAQLDRDSCDAVLAVGGGSSMDAAKIIAAMATNRVPIEKLEGPLKVRKAPAPLYAIPTTAGTGSEGTVAAVISDPTSHAKKFFIDPKLLPAMTALDPELMTGLPPHITAATGMDALTHAVESYLCRTSTPVTERYATIAVRLIFDHLETAFREGANMESRKAMALASYYAGLAFTRTSVGYVHAVAHTFGAFYGTPHGLANAIALPHVLGFSSEAAGARLAELADLIGAGGDSQSAKAERFIAAVRELMAKVEIPYSLGALKREDVPAIAKQALAEAHLNYPVPRYMSQPECEQLLAQMLA